MLLLGHGGKGKTRKMICKLKTYLKTVVFQSKGLMVAMKEKDTEYDNFETAQLHFYENFPTQNFLNSIYWYLTD